MNFKPLRKKSGIGLFARNKSTANYHLRNTYKTTLLKNTVKLDTTISRFISRHIETFLFYFTQFQFTGQRWLVPQMGETIRSKNHSQLRCQTSNSYVTKIQARTYKKQITTRYTELPRKHGRNFSKPNSGQFFLRN